VLDQGARAVDPRERGERLLARGLRHPRVEPRQGRAQIAREHDLALAHTAERSLRAEQLVVPSVDVLPAKSVAEVICERLLHEPVFAVDIGDHG
jgi:hypothetical protein